MGCKNKVRLEAWMVGRKRYACMHAMWRARGWEVQKRYGRGDVFRNEELGRFLGW